MKLFNKIEVGKSVSGCVDGAASLAAATLARQQNRLIYITRDDSQLVQAIQSLAFISPDTEVLSLPAWDCLPYDRVSPHSSIVSQRINCLSALAAYEQHQPDRPVIIVTTMNSWLQKLPPLSFYSRRRIALKQGMTISPAELGRKLSEIGFLRTQTVREFGEFSIRGGIVDIFAHADQDPIRLDFFGDEIDSLKYFDSLSQKSLGEAEMLVIQPAHEYVLNDETVSAFRQAYLRQFGGRASKDHIYEAVSSGQAVAGMEHWLSLLHDELFFLGDVLVDWPVMMASDTMSAGNARLEQIGEFYEARQSDGGDDGQTYRPVDIKDMFASLEQIEARAENDTTHISAFSDDMGQAVNVGAKLAPRFSGGDNAALSPSERAADYISMAKKNCILAASSTGAALRMAELISPHLNTQITEISDITEMQPAQIHSAVWPLEHGFETDELLVLSEQDVFGTRIARPQGRRRPSDDFLKEVSSLEAGDLVVHVEHGIGRYQGLETITHNNTDHDCLHIEYAGGDRLYLPVENIDMLSRYGQDGSDAVLDKLGGVAWQARKAKIKNKIKDIADQLMKIAAQRQIASAEPLTPPEGMYAEFCARFGHPETDDQLDAIHDVLTDLASGKATDRLICGDVGFGKTEVALRAAFIACMCGYQVALVTPTTLLARQHGKLFESRFSGFPVRVATLSRLVTGQKATQIKKDITSGDIQMIVGTHALLSKTISFNNLGLLIIDEEQRFGVTQKERLKQLRGDIHVITLSATPIPRTLQLALSGVRQMSLISTPPVDRLAVRTFIGAWDGVALKEAIMREKYRGGQSFVVVPRISDLSRIYDRLEKLVPDLRILTAHGQMAGGELDEVMTRFGDGGGDILLATNIIESGIDIPTANTIIIHRADMFGLSQLYQLRGRVGRSKLRAYAYLTTDAHMVLTPQARRRLEVMQTLDKLGAGFSLASYDMDIRGAGNLLGDEQSGHVKEVGIELYQELLKQAVQQAKSKGKDEEAEEQADWSPQLNLGTNVLIPHDYVEDLSVRLSLYRRIGNLTDSDHINAVMAELTDRFGPIPQSVRNLLEIVELKRYCRMLNIQKLDAGGKGFSLMFRDNYFAAPDQLIGWIATQNGQVQLKADHKVIIKSDLADISKRAAKARHYLAQMSELLPAQQAAE